MAPVVKGKNRVNSTSIFLITDKRFTKINKSYCIPNSAHMFPQIRIQITFRVAFL